MRAERRLPSLRRQVLFAEMRHDFARASHASFRVVHFSIQATHVHLLVEARDKVALTCGIAGLSIRLARSVNRILSRRGRVWGDRYHARALRTPRETRHALVYVLMNFKKHAGRGARGVDALSSASWFDGWKPHPRGRDYGGSGAHATPAAIQLGHRPLQSEAKATTGVPAYEGAPVWRPRTWLARTGWRRHGLIGNDEYPRPA